MNNDWSLRLLRVGKRERPSGWGGSPLPGRGGGRTRRKRGKTCGVPGPPLPARRPGAARAVERGSQPAFRSPSPLPTDAWPPRWALRPPPTRGVAATEEGSGTPPRSGRRADGRYGASPRGPSTAAGVPGAHTLTHGPGERPLSPSDVALRPLQPGTSLPITPSLCHCQRHSPDRLPGPCHLPELHPLHSEPA